MYILSLLSSREGTTLSSAHHRNVFELLVLRPFVFISFTVVLVVLVVHVVHSRSRRNQRFETFESFVTLESLTLEPNVERQ